MTQAGEVSIDLFTMTGSFAGNLSNGYQPAGEHSLSYNLQDMNLAPGMYFVRIQSNGISYNQQIVYSR